MELIKAYKNVILTTIVVTFVIGLIAEAFIEYGILRHDISLFSIVILSLTKWVALYLLWLRCNMTRDKGKSAEIAWTIHWGIVFIIYVFIVKKIVECVSVDVDVRMYALIYQK